MSDLIKIQSAVLEFLQTDRQTGLANVLGFVVSLFVVNATKLHRVWNCIRVVFCDEIVKNFNTTHPQKPELFRK
jgi:hypothetical protein